MCFGQFAHNVADSGLWDPHNLTDFSYYIEGVPMEAPLIFGGAAFSGVGLLFIITDVFAFYYLAYSDVSRWRLFFLIAACQLGMLLSYSAILAKEFNSDAFWALLVLGLLYGCGCLINRKFASVAPEQQDGAREAWIPDTGWRFSSPLSMVLLYMFSLIFLIAVAGMFLSGGPKILPESAPEPVPKQAERANINPHHP